MVFFSDACRQRCRPGARFSPSPHRFDTRHPPGDAHRRCWCAGHRVRLPSPNLCCQPLPHWGEWRHYPYVVLHPGNSCFLSNQQRGIGVMYTLSHDQKWTYLKTHPFSAAIFGSGLVLYGLKWHNHEAIDIQELSKAKRCYLFPSVVWGPQSQTAWEYYSLIMLAFENPLSVNH